MTMAKLWVKSQDGSFSGVIEQVGVNIQSGRLICSDKQYLGEYLNRERCVEVIAEMTELLRQANEPLVLLKNYDLEQGEEFNEPFNDIRFIGMCDDNNKDIEVIQKDYVFYDMPKE